MCAKRFFNSGRNSRRTAGVSNVSVSHSPPRSLPAWFGEQEHLEQQVDPGMAAGWPWGWGDSWGHSGAHPGLPRLLLHSQRATSRKTRDLSTTPGDKGWGQPLVPPRRGLCSPNPGGSSSFGALGGLGPLGPLGARWPRFPPPAPRPPGNFEREITVPRIRPWRWPQGAAASSCWGHPSALTAGKGRECHRPVGHRGSPPARGGRGSCSPSAKRCLISANEEERSWSYTMAAAGNSGAFTLCAR